MIFGYKSDDKRECTEAFREKNSITSYKDDLRKMSRYLNRQKSKEIALNKSPMMKIFMIIGYFIPKFYEKTFFFTNQSLENM